MSIGLSDIIALGSFYDAILEPLGYSRVFEDLRPGEMHQAIGYGVVPSEDIFTIKERSSEYLSPGPGFHLAFSAPSSESINMWHRRRIKMGAKDKGAPKNLDRLWTQLLCGVLT